MCWVSEPVSYSCKGLKGFFTTTLASVNKKLWWVQNSTASFIKETAALAQEMGGMGPTPGTQFTILWQQGWPEKKCSPKKLWVIFRPPSAYHLGPLYWLPSCGCPVPLSTSKAFMPHDCHCLILVLLVCVCVCMCRERVWWDQPQKQLAGKHHDCSAQR